MGEQGSLKGLEEFWPLVQRLMWFTGATSF